MAARRVLAIMFAVDRIVASVGETRADLGDGTPGNPILGVPSQIYFRQAGVGISGLVNGFIAPSGTAHTPPTPYPAAVPPGFVVSNTQFMGLRQASETPTGPMTLNLYCIQRGMPVNPGFGYSVGSWTASNVTNLGYVARLLAENYPVVPTEPSTVGDAQGRAAAVQAAIWYFSDFWVLPASSSLHDDVQTLVDNAILDGPIGEPAAPSLAMFRRPPCRARWVCRSARSPSSPTHRAAPRSRPMAPRSPMWMAHRSPTSWTTVTSSSC